MARSQGGGRRRRLQRSMAQFADKIRIDHLRHPLQASYWRDRSLAANYGRGRCGTFEIAGWSDCYSTVLLRAYENLECPKRALVGPWGHWYAEESIAVPGPGIDTRPISAASSTTG